MVLIEKINISITNVGLLLHRPENKVFIVMEAKEKVSFIHSITAKIMLMVVVMVVIAYGVYFYRKCKGFGDSQQCQREFYFEPYESAAKTLDKIPAR